MPLIDDSGRLFGKVSVIDLAAIGVIGVILSAIVVHWIGPMWTGEEPIADEPPWIPVELEVIVDPTVVEGWVKAGDVQRLRSTGQIFARIESVTTQSYRQILGRDPMNGDRQVLVIRLHLLARDYTSGRGLVFGDRPLKPGANFRFETDEYAFDGVLNKVIVEGATPP